MKFSYQDLARIALFAAFIAVLGLVPRIDLPFAAGVPITAQTFGVMLAGLVLGPRNAVMSVLLFLFVVALGAPVLSGGRGGLGVFFGPTAGFLLGWIFGAAACAALYRFLLRVMPQRIFLSALLACWVGGILAIYPLGVSGLIALTGLTPRAAWIAVLVFVPGDLIKGVIAAWIVARLPPSYWPAQASRHVADR